MPEDAQYDDSDDAVDEEEGSKPVVTTSPRAAKPSSKTKHKKDGSARKHKTKHPHNIENADGSQSTSHAKSPRRPKAEQQQHTDVELQNPQ